MADGRFRVRVIRAGLSRNNVFYPDTTLRDAVPLFEGARVFAKSDREHLAGEGKDVRNLIGGLSNVAFERGTRPDTGEITADLRLIDPEEPTGRKIMKAVERGMQNLFGLSIHVEGFAQQGFDGRRTSSRFTRVHSLDLIVEPGAGGQFINLIEAVADPQGPPRMTREQLIAMIKAANPKLLQGKDEAALTMDELTSILTTALASAAPAAPAAMTEAVQTGIRLRERIAATSLPDAAKAKLRAEVEAGAVFTEAALTGRITQEAGYLAALGMGGGTVRGLGSQVGDGPREKGATMLDAFFDPAHKDHRQVRSFRECYVTLTGDAKLTGRVPANARFTEAMDSQTFTHALGDAITRRVLAEYAVRDQYDVWRDLVNIVPVKDFRSQERVRWGGYGDLPTVAEKAPYPSLASPTDEVAKYAISKRGGTETVTLEMIANDDVGVIQRIPQRLTIAAKRTLSRFVLSFLKDNSLIYDGKTLFHADHKNLGSAALSAASVAAARLAIRNQTERDTGEKLALQGRHLWVSDTLEQAAYDLFVRGTNNDATFVQSLGYQVHPVWCWTDENDWCLSADPREAAPIELGFLNGEQEPEIFVQDDPKAGAFFTNDQITYKIMHVFGATVTDFRPVYKSVVPS